MALFDQLGASNWKSPDDMYIIRALLCIGIRVLVGWMVIVIVSSNIAVTMSCDFGRTEYLYCVLVRSIIERCKYDFNRTMWHAESLVKKIYPNIGAIGQGNTMVLQ
jgi:hypothetical protein